MKDMLYYPGFEVKNETWLKFALLYFDCLRPIIPYTIRSEENYVSDSFLRIMHETDFISPFRPDYTEGNIASVLACNEFDLYLKNPERYGSFFGKSYASNLVEKWQTPQAQVTTLFEGKYSKIFFDYCIENRIASQCREGIKISNDFAFVYMSFLADIISKNNELDMITDSSQYSSILLENDKKTSKANQVNTSVARNCIELMIPSNLKNVPMQEIIKLRNSRGFNETRKAYTTELAAFIIAKEKEDTSYSLDKLLSYKNDFIKFFNNTLTFLASATVTAYSIKTLADGIPGNELLPMAAATFIDAKALADICSDFPDFAKTIKTKHLARKYVAKISRLNTNRI